MITVDSASNVPPYAQIRQRVTELVASGDLPAGTRLPTVRSLAAELQLATNTVARAYRELEAAGVVVTRGRHGTVVPDTAPREGHDARDGLRRAAETYLDAAGRLGFGSREALEAVSRASHLKALET